MTENSMIEIRNLQKTYKQGDVEVQALRGLDLSVAAGDFVSIVGPSGCGKSTLFNILGGLTPPTAGTVQINGQDLLAMSDGDRTNLRKKLVGFVFQKYNLLPTLSVADNIEIARHIAGEYRKPKDPSFEQALDMLGLRTRMDRKPKQLSGGEQQRVAIARAIVNHPAILLADEPTGNLDTENSELVLGLLKRLNEETGQTILMITHNPEAAAYGHRIVKMRDGKIVS